MDIEAKRQQLEALRQQARELESEIVKEVTHRDWPPKEFYGAYYAMAGSVLGIFGAVVSLVANVIGAPLAGKEPLSLIRVYLTFPLGERALSLTAEENGGLILTLGCCLYIATGMLLGGLLYFLMSRICGEDASLIKRLVVSSILALAIWAVNFYGILSWLQPLLFEGNWITDPNVLPLWVAAATHLLFGWTLAVLYPYGQFTAYRPPTPPAAEAT